MSEIVIYIALCIVLPIALLCFYLERRARRIMLSVLFGAVVNLIAYYINTFVLQQLCISETLLITVFVPIVEEILKAIPIVIVVLGLKKGPRNCIANAFAVGVGFCVVENYFYLFESIASANLGWIIARCVSTGLMHSMSAVLIGLGTLYARNNNKLKGLGVVLSLLVAIVYHGIYNLMVESPNLAVMICGAVIPAITFVVILYFIKSRKYLHFFESIPKQK